jgi:hypothetical protein
MKWKMGWFVSAPAIVLFANCSNVMRKGITTASPQKFYAVTTESAAFYRRAPVAGSEPEKMLKKGELLSLIRPSFGTCKVRLNSGEQGYIANEDIGVASPALIAAASGSPETRNGRFRFDSPDPRLVVPEEPLPEFLPTPIPEPPSHN